MWCLLCRKVLGTDTRLPGSIRLYKAGSAFIQQLWHIRVTSIATAHLGTFYQVHIQVIYFTTQSVYWEIHYHCIVNLNSLLFVLFYTFRNIYYLGLGSPQSTICPISLLFVTLPYQFIVTARLYIITKAISQQWWQRWDELFYCKHSDPLLNTFIISCEVSEQVDLLDLCITVVYLLTCHFTVNVGLYLLDMFILFGLVATSQIIFTFSIHTTFFPCWCDNDHKSVDLVFLR